MLDTGALYSVPKLFATLAFIVNPIFIYLVLTEKKVSLGNYRYLLFSFAVFNMVYAVVNVLVPIDIRSYRYCFYLFINEGPFVDSSDSNMHILSVRCALVFACYAVLLSHYVYRYLITDDNSLTKNNFKIYMALSFGTFIVFFAIWKLSCYYWGRANLETILYIQEDFIKFYGLDPIKTNMLACLYREGTGHTMIRSWTATVLWSSTSAISISVFLKLSYMIMTKLNQFATSMSNKTAKLQKELLRALIVQTVIPIFVGLIPCAISFMIPMFNLDFGRPINYVEVLSPGAFAFCDPIAIVMCLPVFRSRISCKKTQIQDSNLSTAAATVAI